MRVRPTFVTPPMYLDCHFEITKGGVMCYVGLRSVHQCRGSIKIVLFDELMKMTNSFRLSIPYWL